MPLVKEVALYRGIWLRGWFGLEVGSVKGYFELRGLDKEINQLKGGSSFYRWLVKEVVQLRGFS